MYYVLPNAAFSCFPKWIELQLYSKKLLGEKCKLEQIHKNKRKILFLKWLSLFCFFYLYCVIELTVNCVHQVLLGTNRRLWSTSCLICLCRNIDLCLLEILFTNYISQNLVKPFLQLFSNLISNMLSALKGTVCSIWYRLGGNGIAYDIHK